MGQGFILVNQTKKEQVAFLHLNADKQREIIGHAATSSIVTWYLIKCRGDEIQFVSDTFDDWPFSTGSRDELKDYEDQTDILISELIQDGILEDCGFLYQDEDEPESIYIRDIRTSSEMN